MFSFNFNFEFMKKTFSIHFFRVSGKRAPQSMVGVKSDQPKGEN